MLTKKQKDDLRLAISGYAWPGGYPVFAIMADGGVLCHDCVKIEIRLIIDATRPNGAVDKQWELVGVEANWENPNLYCDHCSSRIESAYAEDEAE